MKKRPLSEQLSFTSVNKDGEKQAWNIPAGRLCRMVEEKSPYLPLPDDAIISPSGSGFPVKAQTFRDLCKAYGMGEEADDE